MITATIFRLSSCWVVWSLDRDLFNSGVSVEYDEAKEDDTEEVLLDLDLDKLRWGMLIGEEIEMLDKGAKKGVVGDSMGVEATEDVAERGFGIIRCPIYLKPKEKGAGKKE